MSDGNTIRILPARSTTIGSRDTKLANNGEPKVASTEIASRPIIGRAVPSSAACSRPAALKSPEAKLEKAVKADLGEVEQAWRRYQATHDRDAVYGYLTAVYKVVAKWKSEQQHRAWKSAGLALKLQGNTTSMRVEPFAVSFGAPQPWTRSTAGPGASGHGRCGWPRRSRLGKRRSRRSSKAKAASTSVLLGSARLERTHDSWCLIRAPTL
jgi:hypothetical protein